MFQDFINTDELAPVAKKQLPFPLENIEEQLAEAYYQLDSIRKRIEVVKRNNVTSLTPKRITKLKRMQYKINTTMAIVRDLTRELDDFWI
jgi:predicted transglutaminase-like cysteine proteinase